MAQTGYTPIQLYRTTTSGAAPSAANLTAGELAININDADMALYAENQSGVVKRLMNNPAGLKYPTTDGTPDQIIKTDGSGNLTFVTPAVGGSWVYLTTVSASNVATADVEYAFDSTYDMYVIVAENIYPSTAVFNTFAMRYKYNGTYQTTSYAYSNSTNNSATYSGATSSNTSQIPMTLGASVTTTSNSSYLIYIPKPNVTGINRQVWWNGMLAQGGGVYTLQGASTYFGDNSAAVSGLRFYFTGSNMSGIFRLYGIKNS
jgi:hypothetical protein